jgi:hypothetical protein
MASRGGGIKQFPQLNSFHENIEFTWEISRQEIAFLDVWINKVNDAFHTDVYSKPTDAH